MRWFILLAVVLLVGCPRSTEAPQSASDTGPFGTPDEPRTHQARPAPAEPVEGQPWRRDVADGVVVVAVGDLHGDLEATLAVLRLAEVIEGDTAQMARWSGGRTILVQTGDQLDRGDDEQAIVDLLERLGAQARAAGGDVIVLNGNHEIMNAAGDFRYVTPGGWKDFDDAPDVAELARSKRWAGAPASQRARRAAFAPGGPYSRRLARRHVVAVVGKTAFAHGGIEPATVDYGIERLNRETRLWLSGASADVPRALVAENGPIWTRRFSDEPAGSESDCDVLAQTLEKLDVERLVVGHTPQPAVNSACDGRIWRIDVGMAKHYGGKPAAIAIDGSKVTVISAGQP